MDKYFNSISPFPIFVVYQAYNCHLMKYAKILFDTGTRELI